MIGVTGASGFIGAHLLAQLGDSGFGVNLRDMETPYVLAEYLREHDCRTIVHLAGPLPGDSIKDLVDIHTVLDVIGDCILKPPSDSQIVAVGSGHPTTVGELATIVSRISGADVVHIDADPNDLSGYVDCEAADNDLQNMVETVWEAVESETGVA